MTSSERVIVALQIGLFIQLGPPNPRLKESPSQTSVTIPPLSW
jgi:hypothetical protein